VVPTLMGLPLMPAWSGGHRVTVGPAKPPLFASSPRLRGCGWHRPVKAKSNA